MLRNPSSKRLADELARQICRHGADEFARLFNFTGLVAGDASGATRGAASSVDVSRIGIWRKSEGGDEFVRDLKLSAEWSFWAQAPSFPLHSSRRRVLFLGESAARGMLYDPAYTPAQVLNGLLQQALGEDTVEVLDLARTNAGMETLREAAHSSLQLKPDAVVIFAGNNWVNHRGYLETTGHLYELADCFRTGGASAFRSRLEQLLEQEVIRQMEAVAKPYAEVGIPLYWVIPEFNLLDWRDSAIGCHWLQGEDENRQWNELRRSAQSDLRDEQYTRCQQTAEAMLALDEGQCLTTLSLLADCHGALGRRDLQREYLERARDSFLVDSVRAYTPRTTALIRDTLRRHLTATGQKLIDLREVFSDYLRGDIPGRRMFLDYCHLTSEAIRVSMGEVARRLLVECFHNDPGARPLSESALCPDPQIEADACLMAAIHNAHWEQSLDVVTHYCMQAVEKSPQVLSTMRAFMYMQNHRAPTWMDAGIVDLLDAMSPQVKRYVISMEFKCIDRLLFEAFEQCCLRHGVALTQELASLRHEQHSVHTLGRVNLLDAYYHNTSSLNQQMTDSSIDRRHDYFIAYDQLSDFCFVADRTADLALCLTLRAGPTGRPDAEVDVRVNGRRLIGLQAGSAWKSWRLEIPKVFLSSGINEVQIAWPGLAKRSRAPVEQICRDIQRQQIPRMYPTYGDIYAMTVERQ